uniref:Uncharacterized protein n=1 Tax=viral metagenome TaxID=1070528 RepID=A0A6H1ZA45_9ZZZZ
MTIKDTMAMIQAAVEGDTDAINKIHKSVRIADAINWLFNTYPVRDALIVLGRTYGGRTANDIGDIFGITHRRVNMILQEVKTYRRN